jgi:hypothetical protein
LLQDLPELANNNIILYLSHVSDDANNPFSSAKLLEEVLAYAKLFSQNISHPFSRQTIRVTAMTGAAAMEIGGVTASEFHYMRNKSYATQDEIDSHKETRLNIIDEVSFAGYHVSWNKSFPAEGYKCNEFQYGKAAMCFLGDFANLKLSTKT